MLATKTMNPYVKGTMHPDNFSEIDSVIMVHNSQNSYIEANQGENSDSK